MINLEKVKTINKKFQISVKKLFFGYYVIIILIGLSIFVYLSLFLYKNFYQAITQSEELIILRREVSSEDVNMKRFEDIVSKIEQKKIKKEIKFIPNF